MQLITKKQRNAEGQYLVSFDKYDTAISTTFDDEPYLSSEEYFTTEN